MFTAGTFFARIDAKRANIRIFSAAIFAEIFFLFRPLIYGVFAAFGVLAVGIYRQRSWV
jgi:hypothetical protein